MYWLVCVCVCIFICVPVVARALMCVHDIVCLLACLQTFGGQLVHQLIGQGCPHTSERTEPFMCLSLEVNGKVSILLRARARVCVCVGMCVCVCIYLYVHVCMCVYAFMYMHALAYGDMYMHMHMLVFLSYLLCAGKRAGVFDLLCARRTFVRGKCIPLRQV